RRPRRWRGGNLPGGRVTQGLKPEPGIRWQPESTAGGDGAASHFTDPADAERDQRRVWERGGADPAKQPDTVLSGRAAVALLNALHGTVHRGLEAERGIETWALAVTAYERIAEVVNATRPQAARAEDRAEDRTRVELDDRSPGAAAG
ncbi:hypothetical protein ACFC1R_37090, partial [Kitasatospora sp. NPDC056138]|uniref:hypothetical protein n=1 Tax=Kitasatospora sp. NPDC056138 TaxID=3345724 RepID=UPI0035D8E28C